MSSINLVAQQYRSLCLTGVAEHLAELLSQAEANQSSYLHFAEALVVQEQRQRNAKRIEQNKRRADFPLHKSLEEFDYRFQTAPLPSVKSIVFWTSASSTIGKM